jgi:two-component system, NtrC family, sensor kinase
MAALSNSEGHHNPFFAVSPDLMAVVEPSLKLAEVNQAWEQLGYDPQRLQCSLIDLVAPRDRHKVMGVAQECVSVGGSRRFEAALLRRNQSLRHGEWTISAGHSGGRLYVIARDITVRRRLEQELNAAQRLEAIGQLAAGVAHEINTPMQFIGDNLAFLADAWLRLRPLLQGIEDGGAAARIAELRQSADLAFALDEIPASLQSAAQGVERVGELVRSLREFAHPESRQMSAEDLNLAIDRVLTITRSQWKNVAAVTRVGPPLPLVTCQIGAIHQVLVNLICNAAQAIEDRLRATPGELGTITLTTKAEDGLATLSVTDSGTGIPEAIRGKIFEPFFTTREVGRGTGQGLAIVRRIVCEQHHGAIEFDTVPGHGTTFHVRLPLTHEITKAVE